QTIRVWDARTGDTVAGPLEGHTGSVMSVAFSPDGTHIVSGSYDATIRVWDARTGIAVTDTFSGNPLDATVSFPHRNIDIPYMGQFTFSKNGWITAFDVPFVWITPNFRSQMPYPRNTLVIGPQGTTFIDYRSLFIGETWS
ncbi:WD40-repeat-containing domain protein, partial [Crassisporium funariophilum]